MRDLTWVDDVIDLLVLAADHAGTVGGQIFNCGSGTATTLGELVDAVERVTGVGLDAEWGAFPVATHDLHHPIADAAEAARALGWRVSTSLDEMIERLWDAGEPRQSIPGGSERSK